MNERPVFRVQSIHFLLEPHTAVCKGNKSAVPLGCDVPSWMKFETHLTQNSLSSVDLPPVLHLYASEFRTGIASVFWSSSSLFCSKPLEYELGAWELIWSGCVRQIWCYPSWSLTETLVNHATRTSGSAHGVALEMAVAVPLLSKKRFFLPIVLGAVGTFQKNAGMLSFSFFT